jgi:predicted membrane-bound mannosyltransferase
VKLSTWLNTLSSQHPEIRDQVNAVIGTQIWPLPWYLRDVGEFGYWEEPPGTLAEAPIVIVMPDQVPALQKILTHTHTLLPRTLRADFPIWVGIRHDIWEKQ